MKTKRNQTMKAYWNGISGSGSKYIIITEQEAAEEAMEHEGRTYINLYWCPMANRYMTVPENDKR